MKNRRIVVVAILLVAVLCLGVGYAAVKDTITATGTITYNPDLQLQWTGNVLGTAGEDVTTQTTNGDNLEFTVNTSSWVKDAVHTFTVTVTNTSDKYKATGVTVSDVTNNASDCYTVTASIDNSTIAANNGTATVTITITLNSYPTEADYTQTFTFTVSNTGVTGA